MSLIALVDGVRSKAYRPGPRRAHCTECHREMIAHTGGVVTWHWAHSKDDGGPACATKPETEWHRGWKSRCEDLARIEVPVGSRRADVLTRYGWAAEFQHSSLSVAEVRAREADWQWNLIWVIDATAAYREDRLWTWRKPGKPESFRVVTWRWSAAWVREVTCPTLLDLGDDKALFLGKWYPKDYGPLTGYGWIISGEELARCVINGDKPPRAPAFGTPVDPESWAQPAWCPWYTDFRPESIGRTAA